MLRRAFKKQFFLQTVSLSSSSVFVSVSGATLNELTQTRTMEEISIASDNSNEVNDDRSTIASFLAGKNIFVTGGTGFLGTVLLERLLSATPKIGNIYVLIRAKNGYSAEDRIKRLMSKVVSIVSVTLLYCSGASLFRFCVNKNTIPTGPITS